MSLLDNLSKSGKADLQLIAEALKINVDEFLKYTKKTDSNIIQLNRLSNLSALLTSFTTDYFYPDKVTDFTEVLLNNIPLPEKNPSRDQDRREKIILSVGRICLFTNRYFHTKTDKEQKATACSNFIKDYETYIKKCTTAYDYVNGKKGPSIHNLRVKHTRREEDKTSDSKKPVINVVNSFEISKFDYKDAVKIEIGQINANGDFENCDVTFYNGSMQIAGLLFGYIVEFDLKNISATPKVIKIEPRLLEKRETIKAQVIKPAKPLLEAPKPEPEAKALPAPVPVPTPVVEALPEPLAEPEPTPDEDVEYADADELGGIDDDEPEYTN